MPRRTGKRRLSFPPCLKLARLVRLKKCLLTALRFTCEPGGWQLRLGLHRQVPRQPRRQGRPDLGYGVRCSFLSFPAPTAAKWLGELGTATSSSRLRPRQ